MTKKECSEILTRIEGLHLHLEARSHLVSAMVLPKALYAASVSPPARKEMAQLRAKCTRAVWGQANRWRAAEAVFNLFTKAHVVDPVQKFSHDALVSMRRVLRRRPALIADFERILEFRLENPGDSTPDPVAALIQACFHANVEIEPGGKMYYLHEDNHLLLMETSWLAPDNDAQFFLHTIRESLRMEQWSRLGERRTTFVGAEGGVDRKATLELHKQLSGLERYKLRTILAGAIRTRSRIARFDELEGGPQCQCCLHQVPETPAHVFDNCPAHIRFRQMEITLEEWQSLPPCLRLQGVMPKSKDALPPRFRSQDGQVELACTVQHNLMDMWQNRCQLCQVEEPRPRWVRNQRRRVEVNQPTEVQQPQQAPLFQQGGLLRTGEGWNA